MPGVAKWAEFHHEHFGEGAVRSTRVVRVLRIFNTVLEYVAAAALVVDIAALIIQFKNEEQQRTKLREYGIACKQQVDK